MNEMKNALYTPLDNVFNDSSLSDPALITTSQSVSSDDRRNDRRQSAASIGINPGTGFLRNLPKISGDHGNNAVRRNDGYEAKKAEMDNTARKYFREDGLISREKLLEMIQEIKRNRSKETT